MPVNACGTVRGGNSARTSFRRASNAISKSRSGIYAKTARSSQLGTRAKKRSRECPS
jgi:hypothetical protein